MNYHLKVHPLHSFTATIFKDAGEFVAYSPDFDLAVRGETGKIAVRNLQQTMALFWEAPERLLSGVFCQSDSNVTKSATRQDQLAQI